MFQVLFIVFIIGYSIKDRLLGGVLVVLCFLSVLGCLSAISMLKEAIKENKRRQAYEELKKKYFVYAIVASLLAKMAKADGRVDFREINAASTIFTRVAGCSSSIAYKYCVNVFRLAKDDILTIYDYAKLLISVVNDQDARMLIYEFIWSVATADGILAETEDGMLRRLPSCLQIPSSAYATFKCAWEQVKREKERRRQQAYERYRQDEYKRRSEEARNQRQQRSGSMSGKLADAYRILESSEDMSVAELKKKYRELARRHHPDVLRANGISEEMIKWATEKMAEINNAWEIICKERDIK